MDSEDDAWKNEISVKHSKAEHDKMKKMMPERLVEEWMVEWINGYNEIRMDDWYDRWMGGGQVSDLVG